ncbi:MAG: thioredoxin family protein [Promethearchaeota archaeon]
MPTAGNVTELETEEEFDDFIKNPELYTFIDFYTTWCGPCKRVVPIIGELAKEYNAKMLFGRLDLDKIRAVQARYRIANVPTFIIFLKGQKISSFIGAQPKNKFIEEIEKVLKE